VIGIATVPRIGKRTESQRLNGSLIHFSDKAVYLGKKFFMRFARQNSFNTCDKFLSAVSVAVLKSFVMLFL